MKYILLIALFSVCSAFVFGQNSLLDMKSLDDLQKQFSGDAAKIRIIALLSPT